MKKKICGNRIQGILALPDSPRVWVCGLAPHVLGDHWMLDENGKKKYGWPATYHD